MASFNKVILAGNLTRDPELRTFASGTAVTRISLAINRTYLSKEGERKEEVMYVDIDAFGKQAETICKYCVKGSGLLVEGRLRLDQWDDKNSGEKRSRFIVVLEGFTFLGGNPRNTGGQDYESSTPPPRSASSSRPSSSRAPAPSEMDDADVPF
ncbi:MAG: single-stranded DNA-binding protein [Opitutae bacterium]|nr:single-stranded DNA-binding protein [Opitutae bacterium]